MNKKLLISLFSCILLIIIISFMLYILINLKNKELILNGEKIVEIKLGEEYKELGIDTKNKDDVKITGKVDTSKVGEYKITYKLDKKEITRTVKVIDDIKPSITLTGGNEIYLYKGSKYDDEGVVAKDNYDGDISDKVQIKSNVDENTVGDYTIEYIAMDSSNNKESISRKVHVIEMNRNEIKSLPVLMYHFFYDSSKGETPNDGNWIDVSKFEEQIKYLVDNNYYFPTWSEVEQYLDLKIKLPDKSIVITVDDGDPSFFKLGVPILEKYKVRGTSFMITSWYAPDHYTYDSSLISIESHTHNMHIGGCNTKHGGLFQCIDEQKGIEDLKTSTQIAGSSFVFCYPFGDVNEREKNMLKKVGFHLAFTTVGGKIKPGMDKLELPRVRVAGTNSMQYFIKSIN